MPDGYQIGAVAQLTGLPPDTLRMWERRYRLVTPRRDGRGRLYSREDVRRLQLMSAAVARGHSIGRIAKLPDAALQELLSAVAPAAPPRAVGVPHTEVTLDKVIRALDQFDAPLLDHELGRLAVALNPRDFVHRVVLPVMKQVGDAWLDGDLTSGQEHLLSASLRHLLGGMARSFGRSRVERRLLFATPAGERHEFGILAAAVLAALEGLGTIYLGPDLPAAQIREAATRGGAQVVVLGAIYRGNLLATLTEACQLSDALPTSVELWLGGSALARRDLDLPRRVEIVPDFPAYGAQLARIAGRRR